MEGYIHTHIHTCKHTYMQTYIHAYIHVYIHACIHAYIHTCIHTCIHTYQAEQFAILKALETIESLNNDTNHPSTVIIYTDSRVSLDSISNPKSHAFLVEKIREKVANLESNELKIKF